MLLGITVMIGWYIQDARLVQIRPNFPPMQHNVALGFLLSGMGLFLGHALKQAKASQICGGLVAALFFFTLLQYILDISLGMDELFVKHNIMVGTSHPGRPSPNTSLCFFLVGLSLLLNPYFKVPFEISNLFSIIVLSLGVFVLLGYIFDIGFTQGWGSLTRMALHTATGFLILGCGLFIYTWQPDFIEYRWSLIAGLSMLVASGFLWQKLAQQQKNQIQELIAQTGKTAHSEMRSTLSAQILALKRMGDRWEKQKPTYDVWQSDAQAYVTDMPNFQAIEWIDANFVVRWTEPPEGNEMVQSQNLGVYEDRRNLFLDAKNHHETIISDLVNLLQGGTGFWVHIPLFPNHQFDGFLVGVYHLERFIKHSISPKILSQYCLVLAKNDSVFYRSSSVKNIEKQWVYEMPFDLKGFNWRIQIYPRDVWKLSSFVPELALGIGIFISLIFSATVFYAQRSFNRAQELDFLNSMLQESEHHYRSVFDNTLDGLITIHQSGTINTFNPAAEKIFGYQASEVVGQNVKCLMPEPDHSKHDNYIQAHATTGIKKIIGIGREVQGLRKNGSIFPLDLAVSEINLNNQRMYIGLIRDITERKNAEEQLLQSEKRFRTLASNAPVGIYQTDKNGQCVFVNERWCEITGLTIEKASGDGWTHVLHPEDKDAVFETWQLAIDSDVEFQKEYRFLSPDNRTVWVSGNATKLTDEQDRIVGYIGTIVDITSQKLSEEVLELSRQQLDHQVKAQQALNEINKAVQLVRHANDLTHVTQVCGKQLDKMNIPFHTFSLNRLLDRETKLFETHTLNTLQEFKKETAPRPGIYREFLLGELLHRKDISDPQYQEGLPENYLKNHTINGKLDIHTILQVPFSNGTITLRHEQPYTYSDETVHFIQTMAEIVAVGMSRAQDLTYLEESRLKLTLSNLELEVRNEVVEAINAELDLEQTYESLVEKIKPLFKFDETAIWILDDEKTYVRYHTHDSSLNDISPRIKIGEVPSDIAFGHVLKTGAPYLHADWRETAKFPIAQDLFNMGLRSDIIMPLKYQGDVIGAFALNSKTPNTYSEKDIALLQPLMDQLAIAIHNTMLLKSLDHKNLELATKTEELEHSNQELEQFAYVASHDLQEPLRVITNYLQLLERRHKENLNEQALNYIGRVINGASRMKNLIQDLLAYSRVGTRSEPFETVSLKSVIKQIEDDLEIAIQESNTILIYDETLPDIYADASQITQLFLNLVSNAIKYRSDQPPQIHISSTETSDHWQIDISDNGIGIASEFFDRIFVIFQRLHGRNEFSGTGIGLAICKKIVEKHNGKIWLDSTVGQGTTFHFTISKS